MTVLPVVFWPVLLVLALAALAVIWWNPSSGRSPAQEGQTRGTHWRLTAAVVLISVAALRPGVPGDEVDTTAANLNVYFVVDTTSSIIAEDWGTETPRVEGVRVDIDAIAAALPGARYSVVTFDQSTRVRLPLTTDTTALGSVTETLLPEPSEYSQGSSVTEASDRLRTLLEQAKQRAPERGRMVFYLGDGEQTAAGKPAPFALPAGLVDGGAVLGYGTEQGGRMKATRSRYDGSGDYLKDPTSGEDARSMIDENTLRSLAGQLGVGYLHRESGDAVAPVLQGIDLARYGTNAEVEESKVRSRHELYWPFLLALAGVATWELAAGLLALSKTRRREQVKA